MKQQLLGVFAAATLTATLAAGCAANLGQGQSGETTEGLPALDAAQAVRDSIARSEAAIAKSAGELSSLATVCGDCSTILTQVENDAEARLRLDGGLWQPWPEAQSGDDLPQPEEVSDAPLTPAGLAGYMSATARAQLDELAQASDLSPEETTTLGTTLAGRWASADALADFYQVDLVQNSADATSSASDLRGEAVSAQSGPAAFSAAPETGTAQAVVTFDCVATALGRSEFSKENPETEQALYDSLIRRSLTLTQAGITDARPGRCNSAPVSLAPAFEDLIGADLAVLASSNVSLRQLGASYLLADLELWSQFQLLPTVTLGVSDAE